MKPIKLNEPDHVIVAQHDAQYQGNSHLSVVVVHAPQSKKYVCWYYNHESIGMGEGHYCHYSDVQDSQADALRRALEHFTTRIQSYENLRLFPYEPQAESLAARVMVTIQGGICEDVVELTPTSENFDYIIKDLDDLADDDVCRHFYDDHKDDVDAGTILEGIEVPPVPVSVLAELKTDDQMFIVQFDAARWFVSASETCIRELAESGHDGKWGSNTRSDQVVEFMRGEDQGVTDVLKYIDAVNRLRGNTDLGYECYIDQVTALAWLKTNNPLLLKQLQPTEA